MLRFILSVPSVARPEAWSRWGGHSLVLTRLPFLVRHKWYLAARNLQRPPKQEGSFLLNKAFFILSELLKMAVVVLGDEDK
ncbi:MAG: hypothetical protein ACYC3S_10610 [Chloroflexota bacterium]